MTEEQRAKDEVGLAALTMWDADHAADIVYQGGPLGPTKRTTEDGVADTTSKS